MSKTIRNMLVIVLILHVELFIVGTGGWLAVLADERLGQGMSFFVGVGISCLMIVAAIDLWTWLKWREPIRGSGKAGW